MRRAIVATAGTVVGLVALLSYKSSGPHTLQKVQVSGNQSAPVSGAVPPVTSTPSTGVAAGGSATTTTNPARNYQPTRHRYQ